MSITVKNATFNDHNAPLFYVVGKDKKKKYRLTPDDKTMLPGRIRTLPVAVQKNVLFFWHANEVHNLPLAGLSARVRRMIQVQTLFALGPKIVSGPLVLPTIAYVDARVVLDQYERILKHGCRGPRVLPEDSFWCEYNLWKELSQTQRFLTESPSVPFRCQFVFGKLAPLDTDEQIEAHMLDLGIKKPPNYRPASSNFLSYPGESRHVPTVVTGMNNAVLAAALTLMERAILRELAHQSAPAVIRVAANNIASCYELNETMHVSYYEPKQKWHCPSPKLNLILSAVMLLNPIASRSRPMTFQAYRAWLLWLARGDEGLFQHHFYQMCVNAVRKINEVEVRYGGRTVTGRQYLNLEDGSIMKDSSNRKITIRRIGGTPCFNYFAAYALLPSMVFAHLEGGECEKVFGQFFLQAIALVICAYYIGRLDVIRKLPIPKSVLFTAPFMASIGHAEAAVKVSRGFESTPATPTGTPNWLLILMAIYIALTSLVDISWIKKRLIRFVDRRSERNDPLTKAFEFAKRVLVDDDEESCLPRGSHPYRAEGEAKSVISEMSEPVYHKQLEEDDEEELDKFGPLKSGVIKYVEVFTDPHMLQRAKGCSPLVLGVFFMFKRFGVDLGPVSRFLLVPFLIILYWKLKAVVVNAYIRTRNFFYAKSEQKLFEKVKNIQEPAEDATEIMTQRSDVEPDWRLPPKAPPPPVVYTQDDLYCKAVKEYEEQLLRESIEESEEDDLELPSWVRLFEKVSIEESISAFLLSMMTITPYSENKVASVAQFSLALRTLLRELQAIYPKETKKALRLMYKTKSIPHNAEDDGDKSNDTWYQSVAETIETIGSVDSGPVATVVDGFFAFVVTLPMLLSEYREAKTYKEAWRLVAKGIKVSGLTFSSMVRSMLHLKLNLSAVRVSGGGGKALLAALTGTPTRVEYVDIKRVYRQILDGEPGIDVEQFHVRLMRFIKTLEGEQRRSNSSIIDSRLNEMLNLLQDINVKIMSQKPKMSPFGLAIHGKPGIGKSALEPYLIQAMHSWIGIADLSKKSTITPGSRTDESTENNTTWVNISDGGNLPPDQRKEALAQLAIRLCQPNRVEVLKADLPKKGMVFYNHYFNYFDDNTLDRGMIGELLCPMAGIRRLGRTYEARVKAECADSEGRLKADGTVHSWGSHLEFREWRMTEGANETLVDKNVKTGWMSNIEFFDRLKKQVEQHFHHEKEMMGVNNIPKSTAMCPNCGVLPHGHCGCELSFFDAESGGSELSDIMNSEVAIPTSLFDYLAFKVVAFIRLRLIESVWWANWIVYIIEGSLADVVLLVICSYSLVVQDKVDLHLVVGLLNLLMCSCCYYGLRQIRKYWEKTKVYTDYEVVEVAYALCRQAKGLLTKSLEALAIVVCSYAMWKGVIVPIFRSIEESRWQKHRERVAEIESKKPVIKNYYAEGYVETDVVTFERQGIRDVPKTTWAKKLSIPTLGSLESSTISRSDLGNLILKQMFRMCTRKPSESINGVITMYNSCIGGFPAHYIMDLVGGSWKTPKFSIAIQDHRKDSVIEVSIGEKDYFVSKELDHVFVLFPNKNLGPLKKLDKYLPEQPPEGKFVVDLVGRDSEGKPMRETMEAETTTGTYNFKDKNIQNRGLIVCDSSHRPSVEGMCGSVYTSTGAHKCIVGVHVAGNKSCGSLAVPVTQADFREAEEFFKMHSCYLGELDTSPIAERLEEPRRKGELPEAHPANFQEEPVWVGEYFPTDLTPRSTIAMNPCLDRAKEILQVDTSKSEKPRFRFKRAAQKVIRLANGPSTDGNITLMKKACDYVLSQLERGRQNWDKVKGQVPLRALTIEEALNGIPDTPLNCIPLASSSGEKGKKRDWVYEEFDGTRKLVPAMQDAVEGDLEKLRTGRNTSRLTSACLKDELVKPEKNETGEHRYFYVSSFVDYLIDYMHFAVAMAFILCNPTIFCCALGLNRVGEDWVEVMKPFFRAHFRNNAMDADYKAYDCSQSPRLRMMGGKLFQGIMLFIGIDQKTVDFAGYVLSKNLNPLVAIAGLVMWLPKLFISGTYLTALMNSIISLMLIIYDFLKFVSDKDPNEYALKLTEEEKSLYPKLVAGEWDFLEHVIPLILGDDNIVARSDFLRRIGYPVEHFKESCGDWGITVTAGDKSDVFSWKRVEECEFLKSRTSYHTDLKRNVNIVGPKSYMKPFIGRIPSKAVTMQEYYCDVCENAVREAFFGGRKSFEWVHSRMEKYFEACKEVKTRPAILNRTYEEWVEIEAGQPQEPLPGVGKDLGMTLIGEYIGYSAEGQIDPGTTEGSKEIGIVHQEVGTEDSVAPPVSAPSIVETPVVESTLESEIVRRRLLLDIKAWTTSSNFPAWRIAPFKFMMDQEVIKLRTTNIAWFSGDVELTFEMVAPATVSGALMASIDYHPLNTGPIEVGAAALCRQSQRTTLIMRPGEPSSFYTVLVPFQCSLAAMPTFGPSLELLPSVRVVELHKLITSLGGDITIQVKLYGQFKNLKLHGATSKFDPAGPYFAEGEVVSSGLKKAATIMETASKIPGLGSAGDAASVVRAAGSVAHYFGFSKELETKSGTHTLKTAPNMPNGTGLNSGDVMAVQECQETTPSGEMSGFPADELMIGDIARKWSIIDVVPLSGRETGSILAEYNVTPMIFVQGDPIQQGGSTDNVAQPAAVAAAAMHFGHWSGPMEYRFDVYLPSACAGRVKVLYDPLVINNPVITAEEGEVDLIEDTNEHIVWDCVNDQTLTITVGQTSCFPAFKTWRPSTKDLLNRWQFPLKEEPSFDPNMVGIFKNPAVGGSEWVNGRIRLKVHDQIQSSGGLTNGASIIVSARAGEGMIFYKYCGIPEAFYVRSPDATNSVQDGGAKGVQCFTAGPQDCAEGSFFPSGNPTITNTAPPMTAGPTTTAPVTSAPTTSVPTSKPTTVAPTTVAPTTVAPTTAAPTSDCRDFESRHYFQIPITYLMQDFDGVPGGYWGSGFHGAPPGTTPVNTGCGDMVLSNTADFLDAGAQYNANKSAIIFEPNKHIAEVFFSGDTVKPIQTEVTVRGLITDNTIVIGTQNPVTDPAASRYWLSDTNYRISAPERSILTQHKVLEQCDIGVFYTHATSMSPPPEIITAYPSFDYDGNETRLVEMVILDRWLTMPPAPNSILDWPASAQVLTNFFLCFIHVGRITVEVTVDGVPIIYSLSSVPALKTCQTYILVNGAKADNIRVTSADLGEPALLYGYIIPRSLRVPDRRLLRWFNETYHVETDRFYNMCDPNAVARAPLPAYLQNRERRLVGVYEAEGEVVKEPPISKHLGAPKNPDYVGDLMSGENIMSFRELLKVPTPVRYLKAEFTVGKEVRIHHPVIGDWIREEGEDFSEPRIAGSSLYSYLKLCFSAQRGGMVYHYHLMGDGMMEVSRSMGDGYHKENPTSGVAIIDTRVNPHMAIKFPVQQGYHYVYTTLASDTDTLAACTLYGWNGPVWLKIYRSVAEDFTFMGFNGAEPLRYAG